MITAEDLTGRKYPWFTVVSSSPVKNKYNKTLWLCWCKCGNTFKATTSAINSGNNTSCGCMKNKAHITHGKTKSPEYAIWQGMLQRCTNTNSTGYANYGARGIKVCDRWLESFENFLADMGFRPSRKHSIERTDNDGDYCPENCKWALPIEQLNNRRNNVYYTYNGVKRTLSQLAREYNINRATLAVRLKRGATIEEAITKEVGRYKRQHIL